MAIAEMISDRNQSFLCEGADVIMSILIVDGGKTMDGRTREFLRDLRGTINNYLNQ